MANTDIPNDLDNLVGIVTGMVAIVADTNRRVRNMEAAFIAAQNERAAWDRTQIEIARVMGVDVSDANTAPQTEPTPQTAQTTLPYLGPLLGAKDSPTEASTLEPPNPLHALLPDMPQSASPETVFKPKEIDPKELDWFVGANENYYVHGQNGEPDRRATPAEIRAINAGGKSDRPRRPRRMR